MSTRSYTKEALDLHPWPAATINASGRFVFTNAAFAHWLHAEPGDAVERALRDQPSLLAEVRAALSGKASGTLRALDQQEGVTYTIRLKPIPSASGPVSALALYAQPAEGRSERDRAERRSVLDHALDQISRIPYSSNEPKETLDRMVKTVVALGVADSAVVYVNHNGRWTVRHAAGLMEDLIGKEVGEQQVRPSLKALRENRVVVVNDVESSDRDTRRWLSQCQVCAMMDVNIDVPWGDLVDFAIHYHTPCRRAFIDDDKVFLERVASRIAMALNNVALRDQLRQEQRQLESILESVPAGVFVLDADMKLVRANRSFEEFFGVEAAKARGTPVSRLIPDPLGGQMDRQGRQAFTSAVPLAFEAILPLPTGGLRTFESRSVALRYDDGRPSGVVGVTVDISERKAAETERELLLRGIQVERDRLSALVGAIHDEVWFADTRRRLVLANPAALAEFGITDTTRVDILELAARLEIFRPDGTTRPPEQVPALRALNGEVVVNEEEIMRTPGTGERRYREVSATPVKDNAGRIIGSVAVVRDITKRKAAEAALERTRLLLAEGQKIAHLGSFEYDIATGKTVWSEEEYRIYGLDPSAPSPTLEALFQKHIHPDDVSTARANFIDAMQRPGVREFENRIVRPDGTVRWVFERVLPYYDEQGRLARYVGITLDVTEWRTAEEARGRLAAIVEATQDPIFSYGLDGIIHTWNRGAEQLFGYAAGEIVGRHITVLLPPERLHEEAEIMDRLHQGQPDELLDTVRVTKDGRRVNVSVRVTPILDPKGRVIGASKIVRDISEHKRLEEAIRSANASLERRVAERTEELSRTIAELERFAYTVAHDLRAPLRGIHRYSELLLDRGPALPESEASDYLRRVLSSAKRMDQLLGDLLSYSRVNLRPTHSEALDLERLVREVLGDFAGRIEARGAEIKIASAIPPVQGDRVLVGQILTNLLSNALKFVPPERMPMVEIGATTREGRVRICVEDNGIGIAPGQQDRIFRLFERLHGQHAYTGTGVGLAIVARAAERMGGKAGCEAQLEQGSRFWVELKAAAGP